MRRIAAGAGALGMVLALAVGQPATAGNPADDQRTVTLVTGDRVLVGHGGEALRPNPGKGREHIRFALHRRDGHRYVIPHDALPMLATGALDRRLFDVTGLLELGYDDARRPDLPLIVRSRGSAARTAVHRLSTVDLAVVRAARDTAFWAAARTDPTARIWLDGIRRPFLDRSVPHIGAPAAWDAGYTGTGVTVAVLDTGIDATHPDLAGRVVAARNFTEEPGTGDAVGHGTHVAGIIAGSGGRYRGVAHGANLVDGRVCGFSGCPESAILAGMEWAAVEQRATVVNLSLGGPDLSGLDPVEEAVNRLTAVHGTLFVIAAGNVGGCSVRHRIASPGSAEAGLTVGATDPADGLARFSCQGPTIEGDALKPDLAAPGVDIVSTRAPGTPVGDADPVDGGYARASGTSMAAPHVAGAAALLAQRHPDWRADRLKAALMGSAAANPALTGYQQGAGRVDVARAIGQTVTTAPASLGLGVQRWPHTDDEPMTRTLTYRNDGPAEAVLDLRPEVTGPDGRPAPDGMFTLDATAVTVPAGGEARVTVTADTRVAGPEGRYSGLVVATGDGVHVGTPIVVDREVESYDLTIAAVDRTGAATDLFLWDAFLPGELLTAFGGGRLRLPRGDYDLAAFVFTPVPEPLGSLSLLGARLALTADTTMSFDARVAKPVEVVPPRDAARLAAGMVAAVGVHEGSTYTIGLFAPDSYRGLFSGHIGPSTDRAHLSSYVYGAFADPGPLGDFVDSSYIYNLAWFSPGRVFDGFVRRPRDRELAAVRSEYPTPPGRLFTKVDFGRLAGVDGLSTIAVQLRFAAPATRTEYFTTEDVEWRTELTRFGPGGFEAVQGAAWRPYHRGAHQEGWGIGVLGPALVGPPARETRQLPEALVFGVPMHCSAGPGHFGDARADSASTSIYRNGELVARSEGAGSAVYDGPATAADIRVETAVTQSVYDTSSEIRATWWFRTGPVAAPAGTLLPVLTVRFRPELDVANSAPGGRLYLVPVTVERQTGARVVSLAVEVSYDDGAAWRRVPLVRTAHGWLAPVVHPASGFVSLRATAVDAGGSSVEQTIIRAYRLR